MLKRFYFLVFAVVVACQTNVYDGHRYAVPPDAQTPLLERGPHTGSFKTPDLNLDYQYVRSPGQIAFSGNVNLAGRLRGNFDVVRFFHLTVNFLDEGGFLLERKMVFRSGGADRIGDTWRFTKTLETPSGSVAFAFSYEGEAREAERESFIGFMGVEPFHFTPLRKVPPQ